VVTGTETLSARGQACNSWALPTFDQLFLSARSPASPPTRPKHRHKRVERVRAWGGPSVHLYAPAVGGLGGCHPRASRCHSVPRAKCVSAQGGAGWRTRRRPFQGWKVLVKLFFWALKPQRPAPTPENVGPPPKLGPPPVPVTTTYVLPLCGGHRALGTIYTPVAYWRRHGPGKKQQGECPGLHGTPRQRGILFFGLGARGLRGAVSPNLPHPCGASWTRLAWVAGRPAYSRRT
jgi:hypothetical protein